MKNESIVKLKEAQKLLLEIISNDDTLGHNVKNVVANALSSIWTCIPLEEEVKEEEIVKVDELDPDKASK